MKTVANEGGFDFGAFHERLMEVHDTLSLLPDHLEKVADGAGDCARTAGAIRLLMRDLQEQINQFGEHIHAPSR